MKTIYLREKQSGNFELTTRQEATHRFSTKNELKEWFSNIYKSTEKASRKLRGKVIKATYRQAQTYFYSADEIIHQLNK